MWLIDQLNLSLSFQCIFNILNQRKLTLVYAFSSAFLWRSDCKESYQVKLNAVKLPPERSFYEYHRGSEGSLYYYHHEFYRAVFLVSNIISKTMI
jgi:hypothetical protein